MANPVMRPTGAEVSAFLDAVEHPVRRADGHALRDLFERVTGQPAAMWGTSIVGCGSVHYSYDSGREGEMPRIGFSPRKGNLVLYLGGYDDFEADLAALGKHKRSKACLYLNKLADVDGGTLEKIVRSSWEHGSLAAC